MSGRSDGCRIPSATRPSTTALPKSPSGSGLNFEYEVSVRTEKYLLVSPPGTISGE